MFLCLSTSAPGSGETTYLNAASARIGLSIDAEYQVDVNEDLSRLADIAGFLMQFPLRSGCGSGAGFSTMSTNGGEGGVARDLPQRSDRARLRALDVAQAALDRIKAADGDLNCFTAVLAERALAEAAEVDRKIVKRRGSGPLGGSSFRRQESFRYPRDSHSRRFDDSGRCAAA